MGERVPLRQDTELRFRNHEGGEVRYVIQKVAGYGGTSIVYDGYYRNNTGSRKAVRIKECYPYRLAATRKASGMLAVPEGAEGRFREFKLQARKSFEISNELYEVAGLSNSVSNLLDFYEGNHTVYAVSAYMEGNTLAEYEPKTLLEAVKLVSSVAKNISRIHGRGYLYLDVKPENIFVLRETAELIQLFDFDSLIPMGLGNAGETLGEYRLAYSEGFAPVEQKLSGRPKLGPFSDVYSVGALLHFLIFGRAPGAYDCGMETGYEFERMKWPGSYQDKLFFEINRFFRSTLQSYPGDRYQEMEEAVQQLAVIQQYADRSVAYLCSSGIVEKEAVIGREKELAALSEWFDRGSRVVFISGMGGIGKSTLVRQFLREHRECLDHVAYLYFHGSICETITDDSQLVLNLYEKHSEETSREYFIRKMKGIQKVTAKRTAILVIDNFDGELDEDFFLVVRGGWRVIAITRKSMEGKGYAHVGVSRISGLEELHELFFAYLGCRLEGADIRRLDCMIQKVDGHTLALELIAKQIAKGHLTMEEALALTERNGFSGIAPERVGFLRDGRSYYERVSGILRSVYQLEGMTEEKRRILKAVSLLDMPGMDLAELKKLLGLKDFDGVNELQQEGWLYVQGGNAWLHPLIREINDQAGWEDGYREIAFGEMDLRYQKLLSAGGDPGRLRGELFRARPVLDRCGKDRELSDSFLYKKLLLAVVLHLPRDQEEYIMAQAERLLCETAGQDPKDIMKLYDYIVYLQCQREDFASAQSSLASAFRFAKEQSDPFVYGLYYDIRGDYYDAVLGGAYCFRSREERRLFEKILAASGKAIHYMGKSQREEAGPLLVKYILGKAILLIRCFPEACKEPKQLIRRARQLIRRDGQLIWQQGPEEPQARESYYMAKAWYYTLCEPHRKLVLSNLEKAGRILRDAGAEGLDYIDFFLVPAANMMCELGAEPKAKQWLQEGIALCDACPDSIPHLRKKRELMGYRREIMRYQEELRKS